MPRTRLPPRICWRPARGRPGTPGRRAGSWVVRDGSREIRLGLGREQREEADLRLAQYIRDRRRPSQESGDPSRVLIADALRLYAEGHAPTTADPARIGWAIQALLPFWGDRTVSAVTQATCRRYAAERAAAPSTARRELGCLSAALRWCVRDGRLASAPIVTLPRRPPSRERWLTRTEAARLLRAARRSPRTRHLARVILIGLYTGTRPGAIRRLGWRPSLAGGHADLARGVLYRQPAGSLQTRKRQPPVRLPRRLAGHLARWRAVDRRRFGETALGAMRIVHWRGVGIDKLRSSWRTVCDAAGLDATVVAHTLRHTAITWAAQAGSDPWEMCGYFGVTMEEMQATYLHHHPDHQSTVTTAMDRRGR